MEAEKTYRNKVARIIQQKRGGKNAHWSLRTTVRTGCFRP